LLQPCDDPLDAMVNDQFGVHRACQQLGSAEIDADDAWRRHGVNI
jgi:hypothetical protein